MQVIMPSNIFVFHSFSSSKIAQWALKQIVFQTRNDLNIKRAILFIEFMALLSVFTLNCSNFWYSLSPNNLHASSVETIKRPDWLDCFFVYMYASHSLSDLENNQMAKQKHQTTLIEQTLPMGWKVSFLKLHLILPKKTPDTTTFKTKKIRELYNQMKRNMWNNYLEF